MSASRSVAAAQRRRAGPPEPQQMRGPNTSINSGQVFSGQQNVNQNQMRPGTTGRLAGQQAAIQQQQYQKGFSQNQGQGQGQNQNNKENAKMSIPQAITLITLRLGRLENQVNTLDKSSTNDSGVDSCLIDSMLQRLDNIEKEQEQNKKNINLDTQGQNQLTNTNNLEEDLVKIKQQLDACKVNIAALKNNNVSTSKDLNSYKVELDLLKTELFHTKNIVDELQFEFDQKVDISQEFVTNLEPISERLHFEKEGEDLDLNDNNNNNIEPIELELESQNIYNENEISENNNDSSEETYDNNNDLTIKESLVNDESVSLKEIIQQELKQSGVSVNVPSKRQNKYNKNNKNL